MTPADLQTFRVRLTTLEPASLGIESEVAFRRDIYRYVPGIVLRGAMAAIWIASYGLPTGAGRTSFRRLFEEGMRPGPLRSQGARMRPLSVSHCKYPSDADHRARSHQDEALGDNAAARTRCGVDGCAMPVEHGRGELEFPAGHDPVTAITHVPHEADGQAKEGALHARRYLRPGTTFTGRLLAPSDRFLDTFADAAEIWLGGRRTVAGRAGLCLSPDEPHQAPAPIIAGQRLVLRLDSPAVCLDAAGRPVLGPPVADLAAALGLPTAECAVQRAWQRPVTIGGWHAATGLPKPVDQAIATGSTWVLRSGRDVSSERLAALERDGIGVRRAEGFGRIEIVVGQEPAPVSARPTPRPEPAVAQAATLWRFAAKDPRVADTLMDFLREVGGRPPSKWTEVSDQFWRKRSSEQLTRAGVQGAARQLLETADPTVLRDVRDVLAAGRTDGRATPQWLLARLNAGNPEGAA